MSLPPPARDMFKGSTSNLSYEGVPIFVLDWQTCIATTSTLQYGINSKNNNIYKAL